MFYLRMLLIVVILVNLKSISAFMSSSVFQNCGNRKKWGTGQRLQRVKWSVEYLSGLHFTSHHDLCSAFTLQSVQGFIANNSLLLGIIYLFFSDYLLDYNNTSGAIRNLNGKFVSVLSFYQ